MTVSEEAVQRRMHEDTAARFEAFAEEHDMGITESIDLIACIVLDKNGNVRPQARQLFNNSQSVATDVPEYTLEDENKARYAKRSRSNQ